MKTRDLAMVNDRLEASTAALRRVVQFVNSNSWALWSTMRLTPTQQKILPLLSQNTDGVSLTSVARALSITPATASDSINSMQRKGLVHRKSNQVDGRKLALSLTDQGLERLEVLAAVPDPLRDVIAMLSDSEQREFHSVIVKVVCRLEEGGYLPAPRAHVHGTHGAQAAEKTEVARGDRDASPGASAVPAE